MRLGVGLAATDRSAPLCDLATQARAADDAVWLTETPERPGLTCTTSSIGSIRAGSVFR